MGRRTRKRAEGTGANGARAERAQATRAERDAARRDRDRAGAVERGTTGSRRHSGRPSMDDRPPAPWGRFPLSELVILLGIVIVFWGLFSGRDGEERIAAGLVLASLGGGELALREHLAGFRSHSALLAGVVTFAVVTVAVLGFGSVKLWAVLAVGAVVFGAAFYGFRELFKRRSGGLGFR
jgi:hypothetical protein